MPTNQYGILCVSSCAVWFLNFQQGFQETLMLSLGSLESSELSGGASLEVL